MVTMCPYCEEYNDYCNICRKLHGSSPSHGRWAYTIPTGGIPLALEQSGEINDGKHEWHYRSTVVAYRNRHPLLLNR